MIPASPGVNMDLLHPIFRRRLDALAADPRTGGHLVVMSGVRTKARQAELYAAYKAGRGNLAADPNRVIGERTYFGDRFIAEGSWHMQQKSGWGYAADLDNWERVPAWDSLVPWQSHHQRGVHAPFGLIRTVEGRRPEPWHVQPVGDVTTRFDDPPLEELMEGIYVRNRGMTGYTNGVAIVILARPGVDVGMEHRHVFDLDDAPPSVEISDALWNQLAAS